MKVTPGSAPAIPDAPVPLKSIATFWAINNLDPCSILRVNLFKFIKLAPAQAEIAPGVNGVYVAPVPLYRKAVPLELASDPPLIFAVFIAPVPKSIFPPSVV